MHLAELETRASLVQFRNRLVSQAEADMRPADPWGHGACVEAQVRVLRAIIAY